MKTKDAKEKKFRELSDQELEKVTGGNDGKPNPIYSSPDDNFPSDNRVCWASQSELCEMNGGTFTTDCHCIY